MEIHEPDLALALRGDQSAASRVIEGLWPDAYRIAWSILRNPSAAEDAAQEACARAWASIRTLRNPDRFAVWFYRIVANECSRAKRSANRELRVTQPAKPMRDSLEEDRIDVRQAILALPSSLSVVVVLRYYYAFNSAQISNILRISPVTVRWRLMIAHRRLRGMLVDHTAPLRERIV